MKKFIIVSSQRTGSSFLRTLLDSHPKICCVAELLDAKKSVPFNNYIGDSVVKKISYLAFRKQLLYDFLNNFYCSSGTFEAVGFKLMYSHTSFIPYKFPMVLSYVKENNIAVIHLTRQNILKTYISRLNAQKTRIYHSKEQVKVQKIHLPVKGLLKQLKSLHEEQVRWEKRLAKFNTLAVKYETFTAARKDQEKRVLNFLGVDSSIALSSELKKIVPPGLDNIIENYDEVHRVLKKSEFAWCLQ